MVRNRLNESLDRGSASDTSQSLESLIGDLADAVAASPTSDREHVIEEVGRAIRSKVTAMDQIARDSIRSRSLPTRSVVASTRRPSREARMGLEDLEGRAIPSVMTVTITNHQWAHVQQVEPAAAIEIGGVLASQVRPVLVHSGPSRAARA